MSADLAALEERASTELRTCANDNDLRAWHTRYFGKTGEVVLALQKILDIPKDEKAAYGLKANQLKDALTKAYESAAAEEKERALVRSLTTEALDVTLPGRHAARPFAPGDADPPPHLRHLRRPRVSGLP